MNKKKILFLVNHDVVIYNFRLELIEKLLESGYEVHISSPRGDKVNRLLALGCIHHNVDIDRRGTNFITDLKVLRNYIDLIKKIKPTVVLTYTIKPNIYGGLASRITNTPYLTNITGLGSGFSENSNAILKFGLTLMYKISLKKSKCIFFQNEENQSLFSTLNIKANKSKLLPGSGVNIYRYNYLEYPIDSTSHIYYFGRIMVEKGINEFLKAAEHITFKNKNVRFHLVGFSENPELLETILSLQNRGIVTYHGYKIDINEFMAKSSVVVQPSHHEGMSNVLLEASASGRPVIASNIPGCREIIEDGFTGYLFEVGNDKSLILSIEKFLATTIEERIQMGKTARQKMINEFSRDIITNQYMNEISVIKNEDK